jgi:hypothetical protein
MAKKLLDLYKEILKTANLVCTEDGYISMIAGDEKIPAMIKDKRLVLPTPEHLANPSKDRIMFHPLSENILRTESDVLEKFRSAINIRINAVFGLLAYQLLMIGASSKQHSKLSPDQSEFLSKVKNADDKTLEVMRKLMQAMPSNQTQKAFVHIYLKRAGTVQGKRYSRVGIMTFPLYTELKKSTSECYGVKLRVKDRDTLVNLFEYMVPGIDVAESHNRGSDSNVAPYLDALMKSVLTIASPINDLVELFKNILEEPETLMFEDSWVETFDNLEVMLPEIRKIPMQTGNEGGAGKAAGTAEKAKTETTAVVAAPPQPPTQPWLLPQGYYNPPQPPMFGQAYTPPPGPVKTSRGGLDFESVLRSNPMLAQSVGGGTTSFQSHYQQPPRFAQPQPGGWSQPSQQISGFGGYGAGGGSFGGGYRPTF